MIILFSANVQIFVSKQECISTV